jgi:hypothetical protein
LSRVAFFCQRNRLTALRPTPSTGGRAMSQDTNTRVAIMAEGVASDHCTATHTFYRWSSHVSRHKHEGRNHGRGSGVRPLHCDPHVLQVVESCLETQPRESRFVAQAYVLARRPRPFKINIQLAACRLCRGRLTRVGLWWQTLRTTTAIPPPLKNSCKTDVHVGPRCALTTCARTG